MKHYKATKHLTYACNPILHEYPRLAFFGVGVTEDVLIAYVHKHDLLYKHTDPKIDSRIDDDQRMAQSWRNAAKRLSDIVEFDVEMRLPLSPDYDMVVALYSNYDLEETVLLEEDEVEVLRLIQEELGITSPGLWHFAWETQGCRRLPWIPPTAEDMRRFIKILPAGQRARLLEMSRLAGSE
ncbi:hypothetical protein BC835DRAFT_673151 [Cytidiella melzeri]|nr:hypothetical protein BC835DRAFT_673151 [Cytidiella melzeri]